jgi:hypothetical protein
MAAWSPPILRLSATLLFIVFLLLLTTLLQLFLHFSPYPAPSSNTVSFVWTYLPVALLMVVGWVWETYDLWVRVLVPWGVLRASGAGEERAGDGWLLDYRSSNYFTAFYSAFKRRHYVIPLTYLGFWMAAIAGIVSTSLWALQDTLHTATPPAPLVRTSVMDPRVFNSGNFTGDKGYLNAYVGRQVYNLSRPRWITVDDIVMEPFSLPAISFPNVYSYTAQTNGYSAELNCTDATAQYTGQIVLVNDSNPYQTKYLQSTIAIQADGCTVTYNVMDYIIGKPPVDANGEIYLFYRRE